MAAVQAPPAAITDGTPVPAAAGLAESYANIGDGSSDNLGAEVLLYHFAQSFYHLLGGRTRQMLVNRFKTMRTEIIAQVNRINDPELMQKILYEYSPPLYPDRPNAPPDLPDTTTSYVNIMEYVTQRDGLDPAVLHMMGWIPVDELLLRLGWHNKEQIDQIKAEAFSQGADFANGVNGVNDWASAPQPAVQNIKGVKETLLHQAILKRTHDLDDDGAPRKRARFASTHSEGDSDSADGADSADSTDSTDSSGNGHSLELDLDLDTDGGSVLGDAGAGTGMTDLPRRVHDSGRSSKNKPGNWDEQWHSLPYESRLHKLGPGMTRAPLLPADEFTLPLYPAHNPNDEVARYKGKGTKPRHATWDEAIANAPSDYTFCPEYFAWEVEHGRAAPAVLPKDQRLPWVPFGPAIPPPPKSVYDPKLPPGPPMADDIWPGYEVDGQAGASTAKTDRTEADPAKADKAKVHKAMTAKAMAGRRQAILQNDGTADRETDEADTESDETDETDEPNKQTGEAKRTNNGGLFGLGWW